MALVSVLEDPSSESPQMDFGNGQVSNGAAVYDSALPNVPGPKSTWQVIEWSKTAYLQPSQMTTDDPTFADPLYGNPLYTWQASDGLTRLSVYSANGVTTGGTPYVYDLQESDGIAGGNGGDLFLQSNPTSAVPMDNPLTFSLDMKVNFAETAAGSISTAGLAQVFTGFGMVFNAPGTANYTASLPTISALMQIAIANSQGTSSGGTANQYLKTDGNSITYQYSAPGDPTLPFQATSGGPTELTYNVNKYLSAMIADDPNLPLQATNFSNWIFTGLYIGEEVSYEESPIGVGIQISHLNLQTDPTQTVSYEPPSMSSASSAQPAPVPKTLFSVTDTNTSLSPIAITADSYDGPLSFLSHGDAYSYDGSDNVTISAVGASNPLVASGSGVDTLTGSGTGHSTLDAGTGVNFCIDGGSQDTTFVQNDYTLGNTWDFVKNWAGNDMDIFFGFVRGLSQISVSDSGLGSYDGATVTIEPGNGNLDAVTFDGVSTSAIQGTSANIDGVPSWVIWS